MPHRGNRALHHENIRTGLFRDPAKFCGALGNGTDRCQHTAIFDLTNTRRNQILLDGFLVNSLQQRSNFGFIGIDDFLQHFLRVFVPRLYAFEIQNG